MVRRTLLTQNGLRPDNLSRDVEPNTVANAAGINYLQVLYARRQRHREAVAVYGTAQVPAIDIPEYHTLPVGMSRPQHDFLPDPIKIPTNLKT